NSLDPCDFRADRLYYFSTGDFQSWFNSNIRSNIARIYFGHDGISISNPDIPASEWYLARDVQLITPGIFDINDCNGLSYANFKADVGGTIADADSLLNVGIPIDIRSHDDIRSLLCENVGEMKIEWTDGTKYPDPDNSLAWFGFEMPRKDGAPPDIPPNPDYNGIEVKTTSPPIYYRASWTPSNRAYWPRALKFTFTIYDSKGIFDEGKTFTHIVYLRD
ncbi:MAG: hypothetical protein DRP79_09440, partial [Planctomycetota bacterium]